MLIIVENLQKMYFKQSKIGQKYWKMLENVEKFEKC